MFSVHPFDEISTKTAEKIPPLPSRHVKPEITKVNIYPSAIWWGQETKFESTLPPMVGAQTELESDTLYVTSSVSQSLRIWILGIGELPTVVTWYKRFQLGLQIVGLHATSRRRFDFIRKQPEKLSFFCCREHLLRRFQGTCSGTPCYTRNTHIRVHLPKKRLTRTNPACRSRIHGCAS